MKLKHSLSALAAAVALFGFSSCNDNDEPAVPTFVSMVTFYTGTSTTTLFELIPQGNGDAIMLSSNVSFVGQMPEQGERMMIEFKTPDNEYPVKSTSIELLGVLGAHNGMMTSTTQPDTLNWENRGMYVTSLWQTGRYVNMESYVVNTNEGNGYTLQLDATTLDDEYPTAYLMAAEPAQMGMAPTAVAYSSFNLYPYWEQFNGLRIRYKNLNTSGTSELLVKKEKN